MPATTGCVLRTEVAERRVREVALEQVRRSNARIAHQVEQRRALGP